MMGDRDLSEDVVQHQYFEASPIPMPEMDEGTREMGSLYPFVISGGTNTERYYFIHINDITNYKFNIIPKYFGDEASFPEVFPERIKEIIKKNVDAKIFCVFDLDAVFRNKTNQKNHREFLERIGEEINNGSVVLCPSMPCIEYWFLLHYENYTDLIKSCGTKMQRLLRPHMIPLFPDAEKKLLNLLKDKKYIEDPSWVIALCSDGKLELAIKRAEDNINAAIAANDLENQSFSYVYKVFKEYQ